MSANTKLINTTLVILSGSALAFTLYFARPVLVPFIIALFLSYILVPVLDTLQQNIRLPRIVAISITIVLALIMLTFFGLIIYSALKGARGDISFYQKKIASLLAEIPKPIERYTGKLDFGYVKTTLDNLPIANMIQGILGNFTKILSNSFLVVVFTVYLLFGRDSAGKRHGIYHDIDEKVKKYISVKFVVSITTGILVGLILWLIGLKLALFFGIMAFLLNLIPSIGSIIATILPIPVALVQFDSIIKIILVLLIPGAIQIAVGNIIEPKFLGDSLDLHPITVLMSLVFWGVVWGIPGLFVAVPVTAVIKIILEQIEQTRPLALLMAGGRDDQED